MPSAKGGQSIPVFPASRAEPASPSLDPSRLGVEPRQDIVHRDIRYKYTRMDSVLVSQRIVKPSFGNLRKLTSRESSAIVLLTNQKDYVHFNNVCGKISRL